MADEGAGGPPTPGPPNVQVCVSDTTKNRLSTKLPLNSVKYEFRSGATRQDASKVERECRRCREQWSSWENWATWAAGRWEGG